MVDKKQDLTEWMGYGILFVKGCDAVNCDCHMHMILDGAYWKDAIRRHENGPDLPWIRGVLAGYQAQGVTYLRDGGDRWGAGKAAAQLAGEYGIRYRTPLAPLCKKGHYGNFIGTVWETYREFIRLVQKARQDGADFIKIMISGLMDFDRFGILTEEPLEAHEIQELIHICHEEGFSVMAHANGARCVEAAARAGVDSVEHGAYLDTDALVAMKEAGTVWVPTLSTIGNLRGKGRFQEKEVEKILESAMENVEKFGNMGGLLAPGSDAGAWQVPHGCASEEVLLKEALGQNWQGCLQKGIEGLKFKF